LLNPISPSIAIIGGGLSGLASAVQILQLLPNADVTVFEASHRVGGVIDTQRHGELLVDYGADMFATQPSAAIRLCEKIGVAHRLIEPKDQGRGAMIVHRGRLVPIPEGFVLMRATRLASMMTTPLLSVRGKMRLAAERFVPRRDDPTDESVADFVRRRLGQEMLDRIVGPLVAGIYTADVERLSMQATMAPILKMEQQYGSLAHATLMRRKSGEDSVERSSSGARYGQFRSFPGGMLELIESLRDQLPKSSIRVSSPVQSLSPTSDGWRLTLQGEPNGQNEETGPFAQVVLATPASVASRLLQQILPVASQNLAAIETASTAIVVLGIRRRDMVRPPQAFGFVVPPMEHRRILAGSFASEKFDGRASHDDVIARVFIGGALQSDLLQLDDDQLTRIATEELNDLVGLTGMPFMKHVVRWNHAMPQYHVGHLDRVERIESSLKSIPSLSLAGNSLHGVGIAPVIETAGRIAQSIANRFSAELQASN
jgi:protoporphyrinogen/coproporphyrinogen III oxidase